MRIVTLIYVKLTLKNMQTKLTFLLEDSLANPSALPGKEKAQMMNATCGAKCYEQFKRLNPNMSSQRMFLVSRILMADWYSSRCALTWKMKGTKFSRLLFVLQPKTLRIAETDAGLLLKTPCSADAYTENLTKKEQRFGNSGTLAQEVQTGFIYQRGMLPTPTASDVEGGVSNPNQISQKNGRFVRTSNNTGTEFGAKLRDVAGMLLTPSASDGLRSGMTMDSLKRHNKVNAENSNLAEQIAHKVGGGTSHLNPRFVAEMMGFPHNWTELPFQSGDKNQSKDMEMP
jgi:hypothetical protein